MISVVLAALCVVLFVLFVSASAEVARLRLELARYRQEEFRREAARRCRRTSGSIIHRVDGVWKALYPTDADVRDLTP